MTTSREIVYRTLGFANAERVPRQLWVLPWAEFNYPRELARIKDDFPDDIVGAGGFYQNPPKTMGEQYEAGEYVDEWGCTFLSRQRGLIGEVKKPLIQEEDWEDRANLVLPEGLLSLDRGKIDAFCRRTDKFVHPTDFVRVFERLQFIRGTENFYVDLMLRPKGMFEVLEKIHDFHCRQLESWARTGVDALYFMDDWGSQRSLLIDPRLWVEIFKPLYRDYIEIAHRHGKKIFMHSDGYILEIIPHLIEMGLDALNCQIFCMGVEKLARYKGSITFWGEIDRQYLLPFGTDLEIKNAVKSVKEHLWQIGRAHV